MCLVIINIIIKNINWLVFGIAVIYVHCEVGTEVFFIIKRTSVL
jgi:hypothetical protein